MLIKRIFLLIGLFASIPTIASAMSPYKAHKNITPLEQMVLTNGDVEKVVKALPEVLILTKNYKLSQSKSQKKTGKSKKYLAFTAAMEKLSHRYQFVDIKTMQQTIETTMLTAGFINSGKSLTEIETEMRHTQQRINANAKLSEKEKSALVRRMYIQVSMVVPSKQNVEIVRAFFPKIKTLTMLK